MHRWLPVNTRLNKFDSADNLSSNCPVCTKAQETHQHLYQCQHFSSQNVPNKEFEKLKKWRGGSKMSPRVFHPFSPTPPRGNEQQAGPKKSKKSVNDRPHHRWRDQGSNIHRMVTSITRKNFIKMEGSKSSSNRTRVQRTRSGSLPSIYQNAVEHQQKHMTGKKPSATRGASRDPLKETKRQTNRPHNKTIPIRKAHSFVSQPNQTI